MTDGVSTEERLLQVSYFDELTGVYNRPLFEHVLREAVVRHRAAGTRFALLDLDIDRFRLINEALGHSFGDSVLTEVTRRLSALLGPDDVLARIGSDEFGIVLAGVGEEEDLAARTRRILDAVARPVGDGGVAVSPSASIGFAVFPHDGASPEALLRHAGAAMAGVRLRASGKVARYSGGEDEVRAALLMESGLRTAIEARGLAVHFQPQVCLRSGRMTGAEALVRWDGPDGAPVPPDRFIPLAETTGLILPLGEQVLSAAVGRFAGWVRRHGLTVPVAVNVSAVQFERADLESVVAGLLRDSGLPPELLKLELTETALLGDGARTRRAMEALVAMGVQFSLDDFGTGCSSLSHLHQFPIAQVKIDKSFVARMTTSRPHEKIVRAVVMLAHELDLAVVAEGVETAEQRDRLRDFGCDCGQGFLFDRPQPPEAFAERWVVG